MAFSPASPPPIGSGDEDDEFGSFEAVFDRSDAWQANTGVKHRIDLDKSLQKSSSIDDFPDPALPSPFLSTKPAANATDNQVDFFAGIPETRSVPSVCSTPDDSFNFFKFEKSREEPNTLPTEISFDNEEDTTSSALKTKIANDFFTEPSDDHDDFGDFAIFPSSDHKANDREVENNWSAFSADEETNEITDGEIVNGTIADSSVEPKEDKDEGFVTEDDGGTTDVISSINSDSNEDFPPESETVIRNFSAENSVNYDQPAEDVFELRTETDINFEDLSEHDPDQSSQKELAFDFGTSLESETNEDVSCDFDTEKNEPGDHSSQSKDEFGSDCHENIPNVIEPEIPSGQFLDFDSFSDAPNEEVKSDFNDPLKAENHDDDFGNFAEFGSESYNPFENFDDINDEEFSYHGTSVSEDHHRTVDTKETSDSQPMADSEGSDLDDQSLTVQETNASDSESHDEVTALHDDEDFGDFADFGDCPKGTQHSGDSEPCSSSVGEEETFSVQNSEVVDSDFGRPDQIESSSGSVEGDDEFGDFADFGSFNNFNSHDTDNTNSIKEGDDQVFSNAGKVSDSSEKTGPQNSESDSDFGDFADESDGFPPKIASQEFQIGGFANFGDDEGDDSGSDGFADFSSQSGRTATEIRRSVSSRTLLPVGEVIAECYGEEPSDKVEGESVISGDHLNGRSLMLTVNDTDAQFAVKTKWLDIPSYSKLINTLCLSSGGATSSSNNKTTSTAPKQQPGVDVDEFDVFGSVEPEALASQRLPEELNITENPAPAAPKIQKHADILSAYKKEKSKTVTPEAQAILDQLPDLSFMLSTVLMFPVKG